MHDLNPDRPEVVLLLHPMLANAKMMQKLLSERMGNEYRYLIPDFSGHGDAGDEIYESAAQEAQQIASYLLDHEIFHIRLAFGASMGGVVLMELAAIPGVSIERLFFEGSSFYEHADVMEFFMKRVLLKKHRTAKKNLNRAVEKMGQMFGDSVKEIMARQMAEIQEESLRNVIHDCGHVHLPELSGEQQKNCVFAYGEKDGDLKHARTALPGKYPEARLVVWPSCSHCGRVTDEPESYAAMLKNFLLTGQV